MIKRTNDKDGVPLTDGKISGDICHVCQQSVFTEHNALRDAGRAGGVQNHRRMPLGNPVTRIRKGLNTKLASFIRNHRIRPKRAQNPPAMRLSVARRQRHGRHARRKAAEQRNGGQPLGTAENCAAAKGGQTHGKRLRAAGQRGVGHICLSLTDGLFRTGEQLPLQSPPQLHTQAPPSTVQAARAGLSVHRPRAQAALFG